MAYVDRLFYALQTPLERYLKGGAAHELVHVFTAALAVGRQEVVVHEQLHAVMVRGTERQGSSGAETDAATGRTAGGGAELMLLVDVVTAQRDVQTHVQAEERRSVRAVDESFVGQLVDASAAEDEEHSGRPHEKSTVKQCLPV